MMRSSVAVLLVFLINSAFGSSHTAEMSEPKPKNILWDDGVPSTPFDDIKGLSRSEVTEATGFFDLIWDFASSLSDNLKENRVPNTESLLEELPEEGRAHKLYLRKAKLQFFLKTFLIIKVILGLTLPLIIMASKILSWKAVTISLLSFMLAKILFVKNLLQGSNPFAAHPAPVFVHAPPSEVYWKRQTDHYPPNHF